MGSLKKFTLVLGDGINDDFSYHTKTISYTGEGKMVEVCPDIKKYDTKTMNHREFKGLQRQTDNILSRNKIVLVDRITLPSDAVHQEEHVIVGGFSAFAMLSNYMLSCDEDKFLLRNINRQESNFRHIRKTASDPLSVFQTNDKNSEVYQLHMELLKIYREIMLGKPVEKIEDYYILFKGLYYLRQNLLFSEYEYLSEDLVKRYTK